MRVAARATREIRARIGRTQHDLAASSGASRAAIWRIESGQPDRVPIGTVFDVLEDLGAEFDLVVRPPFTADRALQRDAAHARMSSFVRQRLELSGWQVAQEVEVGTPRSRGWIDILAFHPRGEALVTGELKTNLPDAGATQRQIAWYERDAWGAARRLGWHPRRALSVLLLLDTAVNHDRVRDNLELLGQAFPCRARELGRWLANPAGIPPGGRCLAMIDPLSRRADWVRATRSDGRRSPAADQNYAEFMVRLRNRRRS
jgi:transcriptional regulator with XRE-family HTH domain